MKVVCIFECDQMTKSLKLNFRTFGHGVPLIVMHGVFGSSDNWQTLGKEFAMRYKTYLIDLRNHGKSPHSDLFNYDVMVNDVIELMSDEGIEKAHFLGHSMGGKVAMTLATKHPEKINKLIVIDIAPKVYPPHHQQIFEGFHAVDIASLESRKQADERMAKVISSIGIRQFILKNLERDGNGGFQWKLNLDAIERAAEQVGVGLETHVHFDGETLFIAGGKSKYIQAEDHEAIKRHFPNASIETIQGAGHWVHAEKPNELLKHVTRFLA